MGVDGLPVPGEVEASDLIAYGIPDVAGADREAYAGKRVLIVGSGHSAINVALALLELQAEAPDTEVLWALRRDRIEKLLGGGLNDQLPERGALGLAAKEAIEAGRLRMLAPFAAERIDRRGERLIVEATLRGMPVAEELDRIINDEGLDREATHAFVEAAFRDGAVQPTGTAITKILPPVSRFAKAGGHSAKKRTVLRKLGDFFDRFFGLS